MVYHNNEHIIRLHVLLLDKKANCFTSILVDCAFHEAALNNIMIRTRTCRNDITPRELIISFTVLSNAQHRHSHRIRAVGVYLLAYGNPALEGA